MGRLATVRGKGERERERHVRQPKCEILSGDMLSRGSLTSWEKEKGQWADKEKEEGVGKGIKCK